MATLNPSILSPSIALRTAALGRFAAPPADPAVSPSGAPVTMPSPPSEPSPTPQPASAPQLTTPRSAVSTIALNPAVLSLLARGDLSPEANLDAKTMTQLARGAIQALQQADRAVVLEAHRTVLNTLRTRNAAVGSLLHYLERKVFIGEVLNSFAAQWSDETRGDFGAAFAMDGGRDKAPVMDAIVSIAILNADDLEEEIRGENLPVATPADFMENRRVVYQWPEAGTPLQAPYVMLLVVESQDLAASQQVVQSIVGALDVFDGVKLPRTVIAGLR